MDNGHNIVNKTFSSSKVGQIQIIFGHRGGGHGSSGSNDEYATGVNCQAIDTVLEADDVARNILFKMIYYRSS